MLYGSLSMQFMQRKIYDINYDIKIDINLCLNLPSIVTNNE